MAGSIDRPFIVFNRSCFTQGRYFIVAQTLKPSAVDSQGYLALSGVIVSFIMFVPLLLFVGFVGAWVSRSKLLHQQK